MERVESYTLRIAANFWVMPENTQTDGLVERQRQPKIWTLHSVKEIFKRIQPEIEMELQKSITQVLNSEERLTNRRSQIEISISGYEDKIEELEHTNKEYEK